MHTKLKAVQYQSCDVMTLADLLKVGVPFCVGVGCVVSSEYSIVPS